MELDAGLSESEPVFAMTERFLSEWVAFVGGFGEFCRVIMDSRVSVEVKEGAVLIGVTGDWSLEKAAPGWKEVVKRVRGREKGLKEVVVDLGGVGEWDSSLLLFLLRARDYADRHAIPCRMENLPELLRQLMDQHVKSDAKPSGAVRKSIFEELGGRVLAGCRGGFEWLAFLGECVLSVFRSARRLRKFRWMDSLLAMQQAGAMALPIVGLISLLIGLILGYQAAIQMREYGAEIFVANLVGLSVVREMGPMMTAVILAGRTGAAFAAQIGNMKMNEEVDALETLGIHPVDFLVLPRVLALVLMVPLLTIYADILGILGGYLVGVYALDIAPAAYWFQTREAIGVNDIASGLIKSVTFGFVIAAAGCLRGLQSERNAAGVGRATTSAVVTAIFLIIVLDAIFAVLFARIGL